MATLASLSNFAARINSRIRAERTVLFILAGLVPVLVVFFVVMTFWSSLVEQVGTSSTFTLEHYTAVYADPFTYSALLNTG